MADDDLNAAQLLARIEANTARTEIHTERTAQLCGIGLGMLFFLLLAVILK